MCPLFLHVTLLWTLATITSFVHSAGPHSSYDKFSNDLIKLRKLVLPKIPTHSYLHNVTIYDDLFLSKWLRASSYNIQTAASRLQDHFIWRERERIDYIESSKDWSWFQNEYVTITGHQDKIGRLVAEAWVSEWNVRNAIISGRAKLLTRWITRMVELTQKRLYEIRRAQPARNVQHALLLIDAYGFNFVTQGCPRCLQVFTYWGLDWENNYPDLFNSVMVINVTPAFQVLITTMKAALRTKTMDSFTVYKDKREWLPVIESMVDEHNRSEKFGGTMLLNSTNGF